MALFTDGPASTIEDLTAQDSQLLDVAQAEGIDLTRKLALAQEEAGLEIEGLLERLRPGEPALWGPSTTGLENVVVTPALKAWHTFRTLEAVYRDAYHSQLNDRYAAKRDEFRDLAKWAYEKLVQGGIGIATDPAPQAVTPVVAPAPGVVTNGTYYVTMAWVNAAGAEGAAAAPAAIDISGSTFQVQPGAAVARMAGWNVFAGTAPESMALQNGAPLGIGQTWVQPSPVTTAGRTPGTGQSPDYMQPVPRLIQRG
jgi:hypothetical protein